MLERGEGNPSLSVLTSIAEALDIEVAELVNAGRKVG
jgi:transcriptional regulator with XRE-family HTH domain